MAEVAVVGGSLAGLAGALFMARRGHQVTVIEREPGPPDGSPDDDFFVWERRAVPQAPHSHNFLGRCVRVLREEAPDVVAALAARGVPHNDMEFGPGFEDDFALASRRSVFEAAVRRIAEREPGVTMVAGCPADGLEAVDGPGSIPHVVGVRCGGDVLRADLVVDAAGRRSPIVRWLTELGARPPVVQDQPCGLLYLSRHYRLPEGTALPAPTPTAAITPYGIFLAFGGDNGTFSLATGISSADPARGALRRDGIFERALGAFSILAPFVAAGEPITDVTQMASVANRRTSLIDSAGPVAGNLVLLGDASLYTNATRGQGVSIGFWQAQRLAQLAERATDGPTAVVEPLEQWTATTLVPGYESQAAFDAGFIDVMRAGLRGEPFPEPEGPARIPAALQLLAGRGDEWAGFLARRIFNLLESPTVLAEDQVRARLGPVLESAQSLAPPPPEVSRAGFEALAGAPA